MQMHSHELEGLAKANEILTISNTAVMAQLEQMTVTRNAMHAQLKTPMVAQTNQTR